MTFIKYLRIVHENFSHKQNPENKLLRADTHKYDGRWGGGVASALDVQPFFLLQKIGFAPLPDILLSQTLIYH